MYRLLIVDDEVHAVRAVQSGVDWEKLSITNVYVAYSVKQAKEVFLQEPIDIMICDIEMPQGNGLELLTWVREHYNATESVFLTCHSDFAYTKKAIQLGSLDYLLKPVRYDELEEVIEKAIERVEHKREQIAFNENYAHFYSLWSKNQPILIGRFWKDLLNYRLLSNSNQIKELLVMENIPYQETDQFIPVLISVQRWYKVFTPRDITILEYALQNAAEEIIFTDYPNSQMVHLKEGTLLGLIPDFMADRNKVEPDQLRKAFETYIASCNRYFYCDLSCYIGESSFFWEIVKEVELLTQMEINNVTQNNKVFVKNERLNHVGTITKLIPMAGWLEMLKSGAFEAVFTATEEYLNSWRNMELLDVKLLQEFQQSFVQILYHFLQVKGFHSHQIFTDHMSPERISTAARSVTDLQAWVKDSLKTTVEYCRVSEESETIVDKVKWYIKQNLGDSLSRDDIAKYVHVHPDYLSRLFKKETGIALIDYISEARIEIAKELLANTDLSVSGIAVSVGYSNFSYFAKMFKRATQLNPQEFRECNLSNK
ncbi:MULTISPECIES: response regulator transcription factor [unclassified Paenibacillus]|uniref:response regulator transcription factor n=1 Tax=unclassified Paenibacillus TaxID=185978 RepID=UPI00362D5087